MRSSFPLFVENPGAPDYLRAARDGLARRDFRLAFEQIGAALSFDPTSREALSLLDRIAAAAPPGAGRIQEGTDPFFGAAAVHAWLVARDGDVQEALLVLLDVVQYRPEVPYLAWVPVFLRGEGAARLRWDELGGALEAFFLRMRDVADQGDLDRCAANIEGAMAVLAAIRARAAQEGRARATVLRTALLRLRGQIDEALAELRSEQARGPDFVLSMEAASIHRDRDDGDAMLASLREAVALAPERDEAALWLGEALIDRAELGEAVQVLQGLLGKEHEHPHARAALLFARWLAEPEPSLVSELARIAKRGADEGYSLRLARELGELDTVLSSPHDGASRVVADALGKMRASPPSRKVEIRIRVDRPAPPSAQVALRLGAASMGVSAELRFEGPSGTGNLLWRPVPGGWEPAVPPPGERVAGAVAELARTAFDDARWGEHAAELTQSWTPEERAELAGAFAHPGPVPADWHALRWVFVTQVAAGYCLAAGGGEWEGSPRRDMLYSIARGPDDSSVAAAVIALGRIAREEPAAREEVLALFGELRVARGEGDGESPSEMALLAAWLRVVGAASEVGRRVWQRLRRLRGRLRQSGH